MSIDVLDNSRIVLVYTVSNKDDFYYRILNSDLTDNFTSSLIDTGTGVINKHQIKIKILK